MRACVRYSTAAAAAAAAAATAAAAAAAGIFVVFGTLDYFLLKYLRTTGTRYVVCTYVHIYVQQNSYNFFFS